MMRQHYCFFFRHASAAAFAIYFRHASSDEIDFLIIFILRRRRDADEAGWRFHTTDDYCRQATNIY